MKVISKEGEIENLEVAPSDTWSLYTTLTPILLDSLKLFKEKTQSYPHTLETHDEWLAILDKMIFSFQAVQNGQHDVMEWFEGEADISLVKREDGYFESVKGPNHTLRFQKEEYDAFLEKVQEGLNLFSQYYLELWS